MPSSPKYLKNVKVCCNQNPKDKEYRPEKMGTLYYGVSSLLKFQVFDKFGNTIHHLEDESCYDVAVSFSNNEFLYFRGWRMRSGTIFATFLPKMIGEKQMIVRFVDNRFKIEERHLTCTHQMPINIIYPPCSPSLTLKFLNDNLGKHTAGEEFIFEVKPYDIFGDAVLHDSKEICEIIVQTPSPKTTTKEQVPVRKIITSQSFAVSICLKVAGQRKMKVSMNSGSGSSSKWFYVEVLSSVPHHLNDVRFSTTGAVDENFCADSTVMYRNQWSFLEVVLVDCYNNVVQELNNEYDISLKLFPSEGKTSKMEYKEVEFRHGRVQVKVKIDKPGKHKVLITLTSKSNQDQVYRLEYILIQVDDAPLSLPGSKFHCRDNGVAGEEIQVEIHPVDVFGCPLPADTTTDFDLAGASLEVNDKKETMTFKITKNEANIVVFASVVLTEAGRRQVIIFDKKDKSKAKRMHVNIDIFPSSPKYIRNVEVCCDQNPRDEEHEQQEMGTLYYDVSSLLKFHVVDEYENRILQLEDERCYDVVAEVSNVDHLYSCEWEMRSGTIFATFLPRLIGERQMVVRVVDNSLKMGERDLTCTHQMPINIIYPPCSPSLTLKFVHDNLGKHTAGEEFIFDLKPYDIFGDAVLHDSKEICEIIVQTPPPKTTTKEQVPVRKIITSQSFAVPICLKVAGQRKMKVSMNSGSRSSSKWFYVEVLPSVSHHLNDVRFTATGAVDDSFSADSTVMYRNQWSFLEAVLVDCYNNVVQELNNEYNVSLKLFPCEGKMPKMEYKEVKFQNGRLQVKTKIDKPGKHKVLITLTNTSNQDQVYSLQHVPIQVKDAPLFLAGSKFHYNDTGVAGEDIQVKMHPVDVFGSRLPTDTTTDYNIDGVILEVNKNEETMEFRIIVDETNIVIHVSVVLTKAGSRQVIFLDEDNKSKVINIRVIPDSNHLRWEVIAKKDTVYRRENLTLSVRLLDRFNNKVRTDSRCIPELATTDGLRGLQCTRQSIEDYKVTFHCRFTMTGEYDLCLTDHEGNSLDETLVSITVQDAPLDPSRSSIGWMQEYDDIPSQPVFSEDESFRCRLELWDVVGHKYDRIVASDCIKVKKGNTDVRDIEVSRNEDKIGSYNIIVQSNPASQYWCYVNGMRIENPIALPKCKEFERYDDNKCQLYHTDTFYFHCYGAKQKDIKGAEYCNLINIKRVCDLSSKLNVEDFEDFTRVELPLEEIVYETHGNQKRKCSSEEITSKLRKFRNILLRLLRAIYYRQEAFKLDDDREMWKDMASENYRKIEEGENIDRNIPRFCSEIKEKYAALMRRYHDAACDEIFQFYNTDRDQSEIDLHGLLVVDEKKLRDYERQLRSRGRLSAAEVSTRIREEREHGNEAIRYCTYESNYLCRNI